MRTFLMNNIRTPWYKSVTMATSSSYSEFSTRRISGVSSWTNRGGVLFFFGVHFLLFWSRFGNKHIFSVSGSRNGRPLWQKNKQNKTKEKRRAPALASFRVESAAENCAPTPFRSVLAKCETRILPFRSITLGVWPMQPRRNGQHYAKTGYRPEKPSKTRSKTSTWSTNQYNLV